VVASYLVILPLCVPALQTPALQTLVGVLFLAINLVVVGLVAVVVVARLRQDWGTGHLGRGDHAQTAQVEQLVYLSADPVYLALLQPYRQRKLRFDQLGEHVLMGATQDQDRARALAGNLGQALIELQARVVALSLSVALWLSLSLFSCVALSEDVC
jgi:hypothetical protein